MHRSQRSEIDQRQRGSLNTFQEMLDNTTRGGEGAGLERGPRCNKRTDRTEDVAGL
jgi:hypothetical protein